MVVALAVEDGDDAPVLVVERLLTVCGIDDGESLYAESDVFPEKVSFVLGAPAHHASHRGGQVLTGRAFARGVDAGYSAHEAVIIQA